MARYVVQALIPDLEADTSRGLARDQWTDIYTVPQDYDEISELAVARGRASMAERFYVNVRILKYLPAGESKIVK